MGDVKTWAVALCGAAVACAALQMLSPKGGMGKIFSMMMAAFFLCCMVSPLLSMKSLLTLDIDDRLSLPSGTELQQRMQEQLESQATASLYTVCTNAMKNYGVKIEKVELNMDTSEDGSIYISQVIIVLDKQNMKYAQTTQQILTQQLGVKVKIAEGGG